MNLVSAGAAQTVTGSCHLFTINGLKVLVDCGLFQGRREVEALNRAPFPFAPAELDVVLLSHGHLDHVGRLPLLFQQGFRGPIYAPRSTQLITEIILLDSAKIQLETFEREMRKARRRGREKEVEAPLYEPKDVPQVIAAFKRVDFEQRLELGQGVSARFYPAGHILGSAFIELTSSDGRIIASGDLGNRESSLQADAALPRECDAVLIETTYANRRHRSQEGTINEFRGLIENAIAQGGKVMIPSFALERTQVILHQLKRLQEQGVIGNLPIFLDSPMATKFTELYQESANEFIDPIREALAKGDDPFEPDTLRYTVTADESKEINDYEGLAIIVAGSGMMTGGRITHHLKHNLWRDEASLIVVGYQAEGTLGRLLVDGQKHVKIFGDEVVVRADIATIGGFSAHADRDDLLAWLEPTENAKIYMVHGEVPVMEAFEKTLQDRDREAVMVERGKAYNLGG